MFLQPACAVFLLCFFPFAYVLSLDMCYFCLSVELCCYSCLLLFRFYYLYISCTTGLVIEARVMFVLLASSLLYVF